MNVRKTGKIERISTSVITSCAQAPLSDALTQLGSIGISDVDIYCFSEPDLVLLREKGLASPIGNTGSSVASDPEEILAWVKEQVNVAEDKTKVQFRVHALATNLPHISNPGKKGIDPKLRKGAIRTLATLIGLAVRLDVKVVEIVCGRRFYSYGFEKDDGWQYHVRRVPWSDALKTLSDSLGKALAIAYREAGETLKDVCLALEIEPGCVFLNSNLQNLLSILDTLSKDPQHSLWWHKHIGVNLDVGHMFMIGENPGSFDALQLSDGSSLLSRVVHMHLSDHSDTHFCDLPPGTFHSQREFLPWIELFLRRTSQAEAGAPSCSGVVAVELEACQSRDEVLRSYRYVRDAVQSAHRMLDAGHSEDPGVETSEDLPAQPEVRDVFLCHASEDTEQYVVPFTRELTAVGISFWQSEYEIKWGDSIPYAISDGLRRCRYVIPLLSATAIQKPWVVAELNSVLQPQIEERRKRIFPLIIGDPQPILAEVPLLGSYSHRRWKQESLSDLAVQLKQILESAEDESGSQSAP